MDLALGPALFDLANSGHGGDDGYRHIDEKRPAPRGVLGQQPAQDQADGGAATGDGAVHAERPCPLFRFGERHGEQRQGRRGHYGRKRALQGSGPEEHRPVLRQPAQSRGGGEAEEAYDEHSLTAHKVGYPPADQQQAAKRQRVRRQGPLAVGERDVQGTLGRGEGNSHH